MFYYYSVSKTATVRLDSERETKLASNLDSSTAPPRCQDVTYLNCYTRLREDSSNCWNYLNFQLGFSLKRESFRVAMPVCADVSYLLAKGSRRVISRQTGYPYLVLSFFQLLQDVQLVTKEERLISRKSRSLKCRWVCHLGERQTWNNLTE